VSASSLPRIRSLSFLTPGNYADDDPYTGLKATLRLFEYGERTGTWSGRTGPDGCDRPGHRALRQRGRGDPTALPRVRDEPSELRLELPYEFDPGDYEQILHAVRHHIAPRLGRQPAAPETVPA
jgi:hypothetical protein